MKMLSRNTALETKGRINAALLALICVAFLVSPEVMASTFTNTDSCTTVKGFFEGIRGILRIASIAIVTIAIMFAGYQVAFAHKRLTDVMGPLAGGLLIGGATTLATYLVGSDTAC